MNLSATQLDEYRQNGYLYFPNLLTAEEVDILRSAIPALMASTGPEVKRDTPESTPKIVYAPHVNDPHYGMLSRLPRILGTVQQLLGEAAYVYQSRINLKLPFTGDSWSWHQDFTAWHLGDGMPRPHAVMTAVFLDACTVANGPLLVIPRSQRESLDDILSREAKVQGYEVQRVATDTLKSLAEEGGIVDLAGPAGSVAFIHPTLMHGSAPNMSPWPRSILYLNYSAVSNRTTANKRPWFMNNTDNSALQLAETDSLLQAA
ncbi:phytanoyl-CoA dioxygenase family protein [Orrella sp. JC864]|uniref:phytanoyl-CoA dioxygenase family protein n=1 Tax=Orrella sp. JC864 TaxID=3120298 RepID=UPI00300889CD